jgi:hypothetical protein
MSRTRDLLITNQLLYQLSYAGFVFRSNTPKDRDSEDILGKLQPTST